MPSVKPAGGGRGGPSDQSARWTSDGQVLIIIIIIVVVVVVVVVVMIILFTMNNDNDDDCLEMASRWTAGGGPLEGHLGSLLRQGPY